jgi:hypothetical protein
MDQAFKAEMALRKTIASTFGFKPVQIEIQSWDLSNPENSLIIFKVKKINRKGRIELK